MACRWSFFLKSCVRILLSYFFVRMQNKLFSLFKKYGLQMRLHLLSEFCISIVYFNKEATFAVVQKTKLMQPICLNLFENWAVTANQNSYYCCYSKWQKCQHVAALILKILMHIPNRYFFCCWLLSVSQHVFHFSTAAWASSLAFSVIHLNLR